MMNLIETKTCTLTLLLVVIGTSGVAKGQDIPKLKLNACDSDIKKYCPGMPTLPDLFRCLSSNSEKTSQICQESLAEAKKHAPDLEKSKPPFAPLGPMGLLPPQMTAFSYSGNFEPYGNHAPDTQQNLRLQMPLYLDDKNSLAVGFGGSSLHLVEPPKLGSSGGSVPKDLSSAELSAQYTRKLEDDRTIGGRFSVGSASDHPFANSDVTTFMVSGEYSFPVSESSRWTLGAIYSNNSPLGNTPFPTFVYSYNTKTFSVALGFPIESLHWMPTEDWSATLALMGPNIITEVAHGRPFGLQEFAGFNWGAQSFIQQNRVNNLDRLYFIEKRAQGGVRFPIFPGLSADLTTGFAFDREVSVQKMYFFSSGDNSSKLGSSIFLQLGLMLAF